MAPLLSRPSLILGHGRSCGRSTISAAPIVIGRMYSTGLPEQDVVVIGGGPGGYVAAIKAAQLGLKTTCVEKRGTLGGTCLNVGCIPSKALLNSSHHYYAAKHHLAALGVKVSGVDLDLPTMMKQKDTAVTGLTRGIEGLFKKNKVNYVKGWGSLASANEVAVNGLDGSAQTIPAKNIILATGSEVSPLPGVPIDEKKIVSSTGALALPEVPKHLIVIGGGVIGLEMGSVWGRLGAKVTVVEYLDRIVPFVDNELAVMFRKILEKQGMKFVVGTKVLGSEIKGNDVHLRISPAQGGPEETLTADYVLVATGRRPFTETLGLEKVGIELDERKRIKTNKHFQTSLPNVYAIGDAIAGPMLAHKAEEEGIAVAEYIMNGGGHINYNTIPSVIYTHPEVAWVGKTEEELKKEGVQFKVGKFPFLANSRARTVSDSDGIVKFISDVQTDKILGIHIIGSNAGEMIAEGVLGMEYGASCEDIGRTCHAHPTLSEAFKEAAMATYGKPIHF